MAECCVQVTRYRYGQNVHEAEGFTERDIHWLRREGERESAEQGRDPVNEGSSGPGTLGFRLLETRWTDKKWWSEMAHLKN